MDPAHAPQPPTPKPRETAVVSPVSVTGTTHTHTNNNTIHTLMLIFLGQTRRRRPSSSPRVMSQSTTRELQSVKTAPVTQRCPTAPLRPTQECGRLRRRTRGETSTTRFCMELQTERWDRFSTWPNLTQGVKLILAQGPHSPWLDVKWTRPVQS